MNSDFRFSADYQPPPRLAHNYAQLKAFSQNVFPLLPYAFAPFCAFAAYKLIKYLFGGQSQKKLELKNKTVLIVGASSGLGRSLAFEFYAKGSKLILVARSIDRLKALCAELIKWGDENGVENANLPVFRYLDISELNGDGMEQIRELCECSIDGKTIDVLVNNAGLSSRGSCDETSMEVYRRLMEVNFFGFVAITKSLLGYIPDDGAILNINSIQGRVALPYRSPYSCSKHAIQAFFDSLRGEERPQLQILTVNAGYINTGFGSRALDPLGKPVGREDLNQLRGMSPEGAARRIVAELERRSTELVLAPLPIRLAIVLRLFAPDLLWRILRRKALVEKEREGKKEEKKE
ncbi:hypothetical protein niasHS_017602 [Heterodera schachtii]|uniref:Uncharacterized protein n=1 Tax=Heterodera schachtii TaxID=97005 RepID=A0ABD2I0Z6_HETSC